MDLTDLELEELDEMLWDAWDHERHYPDEFTEEQHAIRAELREKVRELARSRNLWWVK